MKHWLFASLVLVFFLPTNAQDIVIDGVRQGWLNHNWDLVGKELIVRNGTPYIRVDTRGNCHYEYEQHCKTLPDGTVDCETIPKWVCDNRSGLFTLPDTIKTVGKEVRYISGDKDLKLGKMKSFLFWKWVKLEKNIGIFSDIKTAKLIIRHAVSVQQEINFKELNK